jgi:hypothetical protein
MTTFWTNMANTDVSYRRVRIATFESLRDTIRLLNDRAQSDSTARAMLFFLVRVSNTARSVFTLFEHSPETFFIDAGSLLRVAYDAFLQAAYIVHDPVESSKRAADYLDYADIERYLLTQKVIRYDNPLANRLRNSPKRTEAEPPQRARFDSIKHRYQKPDGRGVRDRWYAGDLRRIAKCVGRVEEYDLFCSQTNGCVHSSAYHVSQGPAFPEQWIADFVLIFACRVAQLCLDRFPLPITSDSRQVILDAAKTSFIDVS